jgi:hypothetical protein
MLTIAKLRRIAADVQEFGEKVDVIERIKDTYNIGIDQDTDEEYVEILNSSLKKLPPELVKDCGIKLLAFEDLGPSKEYYPNHGKYVHNTLVLNHNIIDDPTLIVDPDSGNAVNKFDQTFYHELGHGWDDVHGTGGTDLSLQKEWLGLSGWSKEPVPGHRRVIIREEGAPVLKGEYYYSPEAGFTRFYAKRNPWDDFADSFSYYVAGLKSFIPENKRGYFDKKLGKYFRGM